MKSKTSVIALLLCAITYAADGPAVEARLKFISMTRPLVGIGFMQGKKAEGLVIPTDMFSDEVIYRGPTRLELIEVNATTKQPEDSFTSEETKATSPVKRPTRGVKARQTSYDFAPTGTTPIAWIDLPNVNSRTTLILLVTLGSDNGITAIPDEHGTFPPGSNRYLNLCEFPIIVKMPSGNQTIPAGGTKVIRPGSKNNDYYDLQLISTRNEKEKLVFSSRVYHMESVRKLFVLTPGPGDDGRVLVRDIEDRPAPAKAQPPTVAKQKDLK